MKHVQTLIHGKHIVPMNENNRTLANCSIAIQDGRILDILPSDQANTLYISDESHNYDEHIILPGLINSHTHAAMTLFRGLAHDLALMDWLENHIWPAEQKWVNEDFVELGTQLAIAEMLRGGITCFNDMYFYPETTARVAAETGIRAHIGMILLDFPTHYAKDPDEYFAKGLAMHDQYKAHPSIRCTFAPHAPYTVSNAPLERVATLANELELHIHMHVHETEDEIAQSLEQYKKRPLQRLYEIGLVNSSLTAVHMTQLDEDEIELIAENKTSVVHCPQSNLKLASGFCPTQKLLNKNINVAIGTDSCASNDNLDIIEEMHTSSLLAKGVAKDASAMPSFEVLRAATINAATALGIDKDTGSLEIGKSADMAIVDIGLLEAQPIYDPIGHLVYATQRNQVSDVWVAGKQLLHKRQLKTLDQEKVLAKTHEWNNKIANH